MVEGLQRGTRGPGVTAHEEALRRLEREVLDKYHETLPLWSADRADALYATLAAFDSLSLVVALAALGDEGGLGPAQQIKGFHEGISQALRWLACSSDRMRVSPRPDRDLVETAGEFLRHARDYVTIADFHKMYGRGQVGLEVDEKTLTVTFLRPQDASLTGGLVGMWEEVVWARRVRAAHARENLGRVRKIATILSDIPIRYADGHIHMDDCTRLRDEAFARPLFAQHTPSRYSLAATADLLGFTMAEFRTVYDAIRRLSDCALLLYGRAASGGMRQELCMPTQIMPCDELLGKLATIAGLPGETVKAVVDRLRFDHRTAAPDIFQQPLLVNSKLVAWSPYCVVSSKAERNLLKLMARTPAQADHIATIVEERGRLLLGEIGMKLSRNHYQYKCATPIGNVGDVDLLAYTERRPAEVLLVEAKAGLGPDEINEVDRHTAELGRGQEQLRRCLGALQAMPMEVREQIFRFVSWGQVREWYCVVVCAEGEPNQAFDHSEIPAISMTTFGNRLRRRDYATPRRFWECCVRREWVGEVGGGRPDYSAITIGDVTYRIPVTVEEEGLDGERSCSAK